MDALRHIDDDGSDVGSDEKEGSVVSAQSDNASVHGEDDAGSVPSSSSSDDSSKSSSSSSSSSSPSGGSGDGGDADVPPPPRYGADNVIRVENLGVLRLYRRGGQEYMEASCSNPLHNTSSACKLRRTVLGNETSKLPHLKGQGRPMGLLVNWLSVAYADNNPTKASHVHEIDPTDYVDRLEARRRFSELPGSADFLNSPAERQQRAGEPAEPFHIK